VRRRVIRAGFLFVAGINISAGGSSPNATNIQLPMIDTSLKY
jgi:hypothetical protein